MSKNNANGEGEYEIGYKKPPKRTQFKKGQSGNKHGRPKKRVTLSDVEAAFDKALSAFITVSENGTVHQIKKLNALATQTVNKALKGNHQATNLVLSMFAKRQATTPEDQSAGPTADECKSELEAIFRDMAAKSSAKAATPSDPEAQAGDAPPASSPPDKNL